MCRALSTPQKAQTGSLFKPKMVRLQPLQNLPRDQLLLGTAARTVLQVMSGDTCLLRRQRSLPENGFVASCVHP